MGSYDTDRKVAEIDEQILEANRRFLLVTLWFKHEVDQARDKLEKFVKPLKAMRARLLRGE